MNEVIENGGALRRRDRVETCLYEISLHGKIIGPGGIRNGTPIHNWDRRCPTRH